MSLERRPGKSRRKVGESLESESFFSFVLMNLGPFPLQPLDDDESSKEENVCRKLNVLLLSFIALLLMGASKCNLRNADAVTVSHI